MTDLLVTGQRPRTAAPAASRARALAEGLRRHWPLVALLVVGAALRVLALVAIYPGIWFSDTNSYLRVAATGQLSVIRVMGYALFVAPFWHAGSAGALIITQHLLGLGMVVLLYALLLRRGVPRWLAVLAVVPAALDAYLIVLEHAIMSETIFHAALLAAIAALLWSNERPSVPAVAASGLLLGYAGVVRSVAVPFLAVFLVYLLVRRVGWRRLAVFCVAWALVTCGYMTMFAAQHHGKFGFTEYGGRFLYAKVAVFAHCSTMDLPASERSLCPDPGEHLTTNQLLWGERTPLHGLPISADGRIRDFAVRVIRDRPLTYARDVVSDFVHYFEPGHRIGRNDYPVQPWQFPTDPRHWGYPGYRGPIRPGSAHRKRRINPSQYVTPMVRAGPRTNVAASRFLHGYQHIAYTWGPLLAACVLLVLVALAWRRGEWRLRLDAAVLVGAALSALLVASALSVFSYRYGLELAILLPAAAALAATSLLRPRPRTP